MHACWCEQAAQGAVATHCALKWFLHYFGATFTWLKYHRLQFQPSKKSYKSHPTAVQQLSIITGQSQSHIKVAPIQSRHKVVLTPLKYYKCEWSLKRVCRHPHQIHYLQVPAVSNPPPTCKCKSWTIRGKAYCMPSLKHLQSKLCWKAIKKIKQKLQHWFNIKYSSVWKFIIQ